MNPNVYYVLGAAVLFGYVCGYFDGHALSRRAPSLEPACCPSCCERPMFVYPVVARSAPGASEVT